MVTPFHPVALQLLAAGEEPRGVRVARVQLTSLMAVHKDSRGHSLSPDPPGASTTVYSKLMRGSTAVSAHTSPGFGSGFSMSNRRTSGCCGAALWRRKPDDAQR